MSRQVRTSCAYCGVGCGIIATAGATGVDIAGDPAHPANFGRLCSKGAALGDTLDMDGRLLYPEVAGRRTDWDEALGIVAERFSSIIREHGPDAVAFYVSGQLLTEDYYVANKLMKGFIGSANIDTNSRLCMSSSVAGHKRAFGSDTVPNNYEDLEQASLAVLVGSNAAWCHPVLYQRLAAARQKTGMKIVVIDPRRTQTCDIADLHLPIKPGTDVILFNALLNWLYEQYCVDRDFVDNHTEGLAAALAAAGPEPAVAAQSCGISEADLLTFFEWFRDNEQTVSLYSQGVNQSSSGTDKVNAILNCHLLTGRIGKPGCGPFSLTGQPNAMGGREVGGLANQLAAHMDIGNADHRDIVSRFWGAERLATTEGLRAVDMFEALQDGRIKAVWVMATNPAMSLPNGEQVREALGGDSFVVVSDCMHDTDTTAFADVLLPALGWGEKDGTVTNSERRISRQRAFLPAPGEARPDWRIICDVAIRMGFAEQFRYQSAADIFREHAVLSGFENAGQRDFDISALQSISDSEYDALEPVQWPLSGDTTEGTSRLFADGRFFTASGRARLVAVTPREPNHVPDRDFPLILNTGRIRDHWHSMTRTGKSARLSQHMIEPLVSIHPDDAAGRGLTDDALAEVESRWGSMRARISISEDQRRGEIFIPFHWTDQFAAAGRVCALISPSVDPVSGQPESKFTPVRISAYQPQWHGFLLSRTPADTALQLSDYWVRAMGNGFWRYELAGMSPQQDWEAWARAIAAPVTEDDEWIAYHDTARQQHRFAKISGDRLVTCLFIGADHNLPARAWLSGLFANETLPASARRDLLAGRPMSGAPDAGPTVCSCFGVGRDTILEAIGKHGLRTAAAVGECLNAGTNCGSCIPEINQLLRDRENDAQATDKQAVSNAA